MSERLLNQETTQGALGALGALAVRLHRATWINDCR